MKIRRTFEALSIFLFGAMAGGLAWGIRGQYGHESGAMISGVLVGLVVVLILCGKASALFSARAVSLCALGVSIGGSMTYGQTVGLTHDPALVPEYRKVTVEQTSGATNPATGEASGETGGGGGEVQFELVRPGNHVALRWGLLGLFIKGAIWIGFGAAMLGIALSKTRYRSSELALLLLAMVLLFFLGYELLNKPFNPAEKELPSIYFSHSWDFQPDAQLKPRPEKWGGLLFALVAMYLYTGWVRFDKLTRRIMLWGIVGGGLGFSLGQCIQSYHAWHRDWMAAQDWFYPLGPKINWWNMMETTFGAIWGGTVSLGLWFNRHLIQRDGYAAVNKKQSPTAHLPAGVGPYELKPPSELMLAVIYVGAIVAWNFDSHGYLDLYAEIAITIIILPVVAVLGGRLWPFLLMLPMVAIPIAGKTLRQLAYREEVIPLWLGWIVYVAVPVAITLALAVWLARDANKPQSGSRFARWSLVVTTWLYFWLNFAFFHFPWPWEKVEDWTGRTPNGLIFTVCAFGLTLAALAPNWFRPRPAVRQQEKPNATDAPEKDPGREKKR
jgi:hypothetical protein